MRVTINGKPRDVDAGDEIPLPAFLQAYEINPKLVAVAINGEVIPKSDYGAAVVHEGDALEIVRMSFRPMYFPCSTALSQCSTRRRFSKTASR